MTALEDKLRDALTATADLVTAGSIRMDDPLEDAVTSAAAPAAGHAAQRRLASAAGGHLRARRRRPVPVLVVVVVLAFVAGAVSLTRLITGDDKRIAPADVPAVSPARYFVTTLMGGSHLDQPYQELTIRDASTGAVTTVLPPPDDSAWGGVSATADPRTFFVLSVTKPLDISVSPPAVRAPNRMHRLVVSADGKVESLTSIDPLGEPRFTAGVVSPDGSRLAADGSVADTTGLTAGITIMDVDDGQTQTFRADREGATVTSVTWSADGRHLAYQLQEYQGYGSEVVNKPSDQNGIWILDTSRGGSDLRASSHRVTSGAQPGLEAMSELTLNANSTRVYAVVTRHGQNPYLTKRVIELDAATGRQLRVLLEVSHDYSLTTGWNASSLALDPSGQLLMVSDAGADYYRIDLGTGQTSRLPTVVNRGNPNGLAW